MHKKQKRKMISLIFSTLIGIFSSMGVFAYYYTYTEATTYFKLLKNTSDSNPPQLNIYLNYDDIGNKIIKIDAYDNDGESGIWKIEYPDGTFKEVEDGLYVINTEYIPTSTGTHTIKAYDKSGNVTEKSIYVNVDNVYPVINAYIKKYNSSKKVVLVQVDAYVNSGGARLSKLELPDGSEVLVDSNSPYKINTTFEVSTEGDYIFKVYDVKGLVSTKTIHVPIDKTPPQLEVYLSKSKDNTAIIKIDAWDNEGESGIEKIEISDGTEYRIKDESQYQISVEHTPASNNLITVKAYDRMGNMVEKNITYRNNVDCPKITYSIEHKEDEKAVIILNAWTENGVPLSRIKLPNNNYVVAGINEYSKKISFEVESDGVYEFIVIDKNEFGSSKEVSVVLNSSQEAERLVSIAENTRLMEDISRAREYVNTLPESVNKDSFQERLNLITDISNILFNKKTISGNIDLYIKSENMLLMSLDTNSITFEDFSGVTDMEKTNAVNISINSSLPYQLNAYLPTEIQNSNKSNTIDKRILNIKDNSESTYQTFTNTTDKVILKDNCSAGNDLVHGIDIKLKGGIAHEKDIYKTTIKFEAEQK